MLSHNFVKIPYKTRFCYSYQLRNVVAKCTVNAFGDEKWILNGKLHRNFGPALKTRLGYEEWNHFGKKHNINGPAIIYPNGDKEWWINGNLLSTEIDGTRKYFREGILHKEGGPAIKDKHCNFWYYQKGILHREDGPAVCWKGNLFWYRNGVLHREDGPALMYNDGYNEFWEHGKYIKKKGARVVRDHSEYYTEVKV